MNILLIGSGGREHALAWKLAASPLLSKLYVAPGNPGIAKLATCVALEWRDFDAVIGFCGRFNIELVVVGPEQPLVEGLADALKAANIRCFGPSRAAAQLEGSKGFTKDLCTKAQIPTAAYAKYSTKAAALAGLADFSIPVVIKADGLAAGKGVIIAETHAEAQAALEHMFGGGFGDAGAAVVIEEFMEGEEASFFGLSDGVTAIPFGTAQDHKRVGDGDTGPNTGGMGAYSPATIVTPELTQTIMQTIIQPTVDAMRAAGTPYVGVLFAGLMLTPEGPKLIEYNCRFGDPETQVLMLRLASDLVPALCAACDGALAHFAVQWRDATALTIVMAANGYPEKPELGTTIRNLAAAEAIAGAPVFHAGTKLIDDVLVANGGRVLNVCGTAATIAEAQKIAYAALNTIDWRQGFARRDIGWREIARST
jgi:phosphoribosylamine---glycine ligase